MPSYIEKIVARSGTFWLESYLHGFQANLALTEQNAARFEKVVLARPQVADLARNPLHLTIRHFQEYLATMDVDQDGRS